MSITSAWDLRFLDMAKLVSEWSKDPSTKTGSVIADPDRRVVSVGYNGLPKGVPDLDIYLNERDTKYRMVVHCETNAILFANRPSLQGCTLYTWPFMSCSTCAGLVIQTGITRVVAPISDNPRWLENFEVSKRMFGLAGVEIRLVEYGD